jgi:hypothetical protein
MMKRFLACLGFVLAFAAPQANAALISTEEASAAQERERVLALVERPEVAQELQKFGIAPEDAKARVAAMSDAEVRYLAGKLDALPAGGQISTQNLLLIIIIVLLIVILL